MLKLYTRGRIQRILRRLRPQLAAIEAEYGVPVPCMQAILAQEMPQIDALDALADMAVALYWLRWRVKKRLLPRLSPAKPLLGKRDSSTGYAQIYAVTAIGAICYAVSQGITDKSALGLSAAFLDPKEPADLCRIWHRLRKDRVFNLRCAALNLLYAGAQMTGSDDLAAASPEELQLIFTRYNANALHITAYGRQAYQLYLAFRAEEGDAASAKKEA